MVTAFKKFIPFAKVDSAKREVWGIVTAELPDKDDEVCDYEKTKPFYEDVITEMRKATDGKNFFPLREMHGLEAAGKCIGFDFRDADKEIFMGFKVVDDTAWKKVDEGVYTGFSQGGMKVGEMVEDPIFKGCMRYVANPSEVSLVDNPCLAAAHFAYVKADGAVELRKFKNIAPVEQADARILELERQVSLIKTQGIVTIGGKNYKIDVLKGGGKTKRVAGEDLAASAFLLVGDSEKTDTWNLPVRFSSEAKTVRHIRNALARINQVKGHSADAIATARKKLHALAAKHGIDVSGENEKLAAIHAYLRKRVRMAVNKTRLRKGDIGHGLSFLDADLGKLTKGMYEVSRLAQFVQGLGFMLYDVVSEQQWEKDSDSPLPGMLAENVNDILDTFVAMVAEEVSEFRDDIDARIAPVA